MKAIHRLFEYIKTKDIKPTRLEKEIGLSNGYLGTQLKREADLGEGVLNKIIDYCLDISPEWLLTGRGQMLRSDGSPISAETSASERENALLKEMLADERQKNGQLHREVGALEEKLGTRTQVAHKRFYPTQPTVPDVSSTLDNPHVTPPTIPTIHRVQGAERRVPK